MAKIRTTKQHEKSGSRTTSLGKIEFDEEGVSKDSYELDQVKELCSISSTLEVVFEDGEAPVEETAEKSSGRGRRGRGKAKAEDTGAGGDVGSPEETAEDAAEETGNLEEEEEEETEDTGGDAAEEEEELGEQNQLILDNLKESSVESIYQMMEQVGVEAEEYSDIDVTSEGGKEALIDFAFGKLRVDEGGEEE